MKKILATILLITYFAFSSGVVINYHFCMDRLASARLFDKESDICGNCGMHSDESNGCCHDEVRVLKAEDDQNSSASFTISIKSPEKDLGLLATIFITPSTDNHTSLHAVAHPPPLLEGQDIYLQNRVFRI